MTNWGSFRINYKWGRSMTTAREPSCWGFPVCRQILPLRIACINELEFLRTGPAFDLFFSGQRSLDILGLFKMNKAHNTIFPGELAAHALPMFKDPTNQIIGDACIQRFRATAHDVDIIVFHVALLLSFQLSCRHPPGTTHQRGHPAQNTSVVILSHAPALSS